MIISHEYSFSDDFNIATADTAATATTVANITAANVAITSG